MKRLTAICLMILLTGACSRPETETPEYHLSSFQLPLSDRTINMSGRLFLNETEEYVLITDPAERAIVKQVFYRTDSTKILIRKGRGPNEYTNAQLCGIEPNGDFCLMSGTLRKIYRHARDGSPIRHVDMETYFVSAVGLKDRYISYGDFSVSDNTMYTISDASGRTICRFGAYPDDGVPADFVYKTIAYQGRLVANDARSRFALLISRGEAFDIYEIRKNSIPVRIASSRKELLSYRPMEGAIGVDYDECKNGYLDACASERFIYALYSGKKPAGETLPDIYKSLQSNMIRLYDWDGNLRANLITDVELLNLCVTANDSLMIGLYNDEGIFRLCTFDIGEIIRQIAAAPNNRQLSKTDDRNVS